MADPRIIPSEKRKGVCSSIREVADELQLAMRISDRERARQVDESVQSVRRFRLAKLITPKNYKKHLDWILTNWKNFPKLFSQQRINGFKGGYKRWLQQGGRHKSAVPSKELKEQEELEKSKDQSRLPFSREKVATKQMQKGERKEDIVKKEKQKGVEVEVKVVEGEAQELREIVWFLVKVYENMAAFSDKIAEVMGKRYAISGTTLAKVVRDGEKLTLLMYRDLVNIGCIMGRDHFPVDVLMTERRRYKERVKKEGRKEDQKCLLLEFKVSVEERNTAESPEASKNPKDYDATVSVPAGKSILLIDVAKGKPFRVEIRKG